MSDAHFKGQPATPYRPLGFELKQMRENIRESLAEVSGAIEIDIDMYEQIESGQVRPDEDILLLLINHFEVQDHVAIKLWELAGYEEPPVERNNTSRTPAIMVVAVDVRTMYTDSVQIHMNDAGIVMQFGQASNNNQQIPVSKVGMSYDQAEEVLNALQTSLLKAKYLRGPKKLPMPDNTPEQN